MTRINFVHKKFVKRYQFRNVFFASRTLFHGEHEKETSPQKTVFASCTTNEPHTFSYTYRLHMHLREQENVYARQRRKSCENNAPHNGYIPPCVLLPSL